MNILVYDKIIPSANAKQVTYTINENGCWICCSHVAKTADGYTVLGYKGQRWRLHRLAFIIERGEIPNDIVVRHMCDNPTCFNVEHLELGTQKDNVRDAIDRGRFKNNEGFSNPRSKLTIEDVKEIKRLLPKLSNIQLGRKFNVDRTQIWKIRTGRRYADVQ